MEVKYGLSSIIIINSYQYHNADISNRIFILITANIT